MSSLSPCSACRRHVRDDDIDCPFCAAPLGAPAPRVARAPLTGEKRSTLFAVGVSLAASTCVAESVVPVYGAPAPPMSQGFAGTGMGGSGRGGSGTGGSGMGFAGVDGNAVPVYGAPVPPSPGGSGSGGAAGEPSDAGSTEVLDAALTLDATNADAEQP